MTDRPDDLREVNELLDHFGTTVDRGPDLPAPQPREEPATEAITLLRELREWATHQGGIRWSDRINATIRRLRTEAAAHATERPDPLRHHPPDCDCSDCTAA